MILVQLTTRTDSFIFAIDLNHCIIPNLFSVKLTPHDKSLFECNFNQLPCFPFQNSFIALIESEALHQTIYQWTLSILEKVGFSIWFIIISSVLLNQATKSKNQFKRRPIHASPPQCIRLKDHLYRMAIVEVQQYLTKPNHCIWPIRTHYTFASTNDYICM